MTHPQSGREVLFLGFENSTDKETVGAERRGIPLPAVRIEFHAVGGGREAEAERPIAAIRIHRLERILPTIPSGWKEDSLSVGTGYQLTVHAVSLGLLPSATVAEFPDLL